MELHIRREDALSGRQWKLIQLFSSANVYFQPSSYLLVIKVHPSDVSFGVIYSLMETTQTCFALKVRLYAAHKILEL